MLPRGNSKTLFRNKRFMLEEMLQPIAIAIHLEYETPYSFLFSRRFFNFVLLYFFQINSEINSMKWKKKLNTGWFSYSKNVANFDAFLWIIFIKHKPLISEEWKGSIRSFMNKENWFLLHIIDHSKELYINIGTITNIYLLSQCTW